MANKSDQAHQDAVREAMRTSGQPPEGTKIDFGAREQIARYTDEDAQADAERQTAHAEAMLGGDPDKVAETAADLQEYPPTRGVAGGTAP